MGGVLARYFYLYKIDYSYLYFVTKLTDNHEVIKINKNYIKNDLL